MDRNRSATAAPAAAVVLVGGLLAGPLLGMPAAGASPSPAPSPSSSPPAPGEVPPSLSVVPEDSVAAAPVEVTVSVRPGLEGTVRLLAYTRPSTTLQEVRRGTVTRDRGSVTWTVRPSASTRLVAEGPGGTSEPVVLPVAPRLTLALGEEVSCAVVTGTVFPAAAGRTVRVALTVDGEDSVAVRRSDAQGRYVVRACPADGLAQSVTAFAETRNAQTWAPARAGGGRSVTVD